MVVVGVGGWGFELVVGWVLVFGSVGAWCDLGLMLV